MKKKIFFIISIFIIQTSLAQSKVDSLTVFRNLINQAELKFADSLYSESEILYDEALKFSFEKGFRIDHYFNALKCAKIQHNFAKCAYYLQQIILLGFEENKILENDDVKDMANRKEIKEVLSEYKSLRKRYFINIDFDLYCEIEKLLEKDQMLRNPDIYRAIKNLSEKSLDSVIGNLETFVDNDNGSKFFDIIKKSGLLTFKTVGRAESSVHILILHLTIDGQNDSNEIQLLEPLFLEAIKKGELAPYRYCVWKDRIALWIKKEKQIYGTFNKFDEFNPIEDIKNIDKRRKSIGLEPLRDYAKKQNLKLPSGYE
jgi:hypothetical protein